VSACLGHPAECADRAREVRRPSLDGASHDQDGRNREPQFLSRRSSALVSILCPFKLARRSSPARSDGVQVQRQTPYRTVLAWRALLRSRSLRHTRTRVRDLCRAKLSRAATTTRGGARTAGTASDAVPHRSYMARALMRCRSLRHTRTRVRDLCRIQALTRHDDRSGEELARLLIKSRMQRSAAAGLPTRLALDHLAMEPILASALPRSRARSPRDGTDSRDSATPRTLPIRRSASIRAAPRSVPADVRRELLEPRRLASERADDAPPQRVRVGEEHPVDVERRRQP
jgi:hypothetical protein